MASGTLQNPGTGCGACGGVGCSACSGGNTSHSRRAKVKAFLCAYWAHTSLFLTFLAIMAVAGWTYVTSSAKATMVATPVSSAVPSKDVLKVDSKDAPKIEVVTTPVVMTPVVTKTKADPDAYLDWAAFGDQKSFGFWSTTVIARFPNRSEAVKAAILLTGTAVTDNEGMRAKLSPEGGIDVWVTGHPERLAVIVHTMVKASRDSKEVITPEIVNGDALPPYRGMTWYEEMYGYARDRG